MNRPPFFVMARGWLDHPDLATNEPFTRREAWAWLIENVAYGGTKQRVGGHVVQVERGQLSTSYRMLAKEWNRPVAWVQRFLGRMETGTAINTATDTGRLLITICNYDRYQLGAKIGDTGTDTERDTPAVQRRYAGGTQKKEGKEVRKKGLRPFKAADLFAEGDPKATGTAPPKSEGASEPDPNEAFIEAGVAKLAAMTGKPPKSLQGLLRAWVRDTGNDGAAVLGFIEAAEARGSKRPVPDVTVDVRNYVRPTLKTESVPTTDPVPDIAGGFKVSAVIARCDAIANDSLEGLLPEFPRFVADALTRIEGHEADLRIYDIVRQATRYGVSRIKSVGWFYSALAPLTRGRAAA